MIKQKATYNKQFNLIDYKEYYNDAIVLHEEYDDMGNKTYKEDISNIRLWEYLNDGSIIETIINDNEDKGWDKITTDSNGRIIKKEYDN